MPFAISGYVLEPPRVGQSNSPFTSTPNNFVSNQGLFNAAYPTDESQPRADYLVLVFSEGTPHPGLLTSARLGWTKNEVVQRFDYDAREGRFKPLPGGLLATVGVLGANSNTQRLKVTPPAQALPAAPFRLSLGTIGSGLTQTVSLVVNDGAFGSPPVGTTELSLTTGNLNWNSSDLVTFAGQPVRFQQQQYFTYTKSTGRLGLINDPVVLLNPIPGTGQAPLLRIGYGLYFQTNEVPNEGGFSPNPPVGHIEWALTTGRLKFNSSDLAANAGLPVYYDGALFARDLLLPRQSIGTVNSPSPVVGLPPAGGDLIFSLPSNTPYYQFPQFQLTASAFDPTGQAGVVQVDTGSGAVQFSLADRNQYGSQPVEVVFGDLLIDHGVSVRFYRTPVNLDASQPVKDVTAIYSVEGAIWASPIIGSPLVFLPSVPIDDPTFPITVTVAQGSGTFTGTLPRLDVPSPPPGVGYYIDFEARVFNYAQRKNQQLVSVTSPSTANLPDPLVLPGNLALELETGVGTNVFQSLVLGVDALFEATPGLVSFTTTHGVPLTEGSSASFSGTTFTDGSADFIGSGVQAGDTLVVTSTSAKGVYTVASVTNATTLVTDVVAQTPSVSSPPTPVSVSNAAYQIYRGEEILADRFFDEVELLDPSTRVELIRSLGIIQNNTSILGVTAGTFPNFTTLVSPIDLPASGVQVGDTVQLQSGPDVGSLRVITFVDQFTLTVSSGYPFTSLTSASFSVSRRRNIPSNTGSTSRFRFGKSTFSTTTTLVANDGSFTNPALLPAGTVEVSQTTGNLNFSTSDLSSEAVYWARTLTPKTDYILSPGLGLVQFTRRLLSLDEALITYTPAPPVTDPPTLPGSPIVEPATFLIRKEVVQPHPAPTSTVVFNPTLRTVAPNPIPAVFRGGRPQDLGIQCVVDVASSTVTFLPDNQITDALPHGAILAPNERVYVDYFVYEAMGGEKTTSVLQSPMLTASIVIREGTNSFTVYGDHTSNFPSGYLLRIEQEQVYSLGSATYDGLTTTVTLAGAQVFQDSFTNPRLFVSSGPIRTTSLPLLPSYFATELQTFEPIARGMNTFVLNGDRTSAYQTGVVLFFTDLGATFTDFVQVTGSRYDSSTGKTQVILAANTLRQYEQGGQFLQYSVRPLLEDSATVVSTDQPPILTQPLTVFRRVDGQAGILLSQPEDFTIDDSGTVNFTLPLRSQEEFGVLYIGHRTLAAGLRLRASYTCSIAPDSSNGLAGQILKADYSIYSPDSFYYRVETLTNFRGEYAQEIEQAAMSGTPSSGPVTSNASTPQLFQQGRESVYFPEGHLANQDIVARGSLLWYNKVVNHLEDALQNMDGRVVGNRSGRFIFDGTTGAQHPPGPVENQIDDVIKVSDAPYTTTYPPFAVVSIGTFQKYYFPGPLSRFYPTSRHAFGVAAPGSNTGDEILDTGSKNLTSVSNVRTRSAWSITTAAGISGATTLQVDNANGSDTLIRPPILNGMQLVVQDRSGAFLVAQGSPLTVVSTTATSITFTPGLPIAVPAGSTVFQSPVDAGVSYYQFGRDVDANFEQGQLTYVKPYPPFDGSVPIIPSELEIHPIPGGAAISLDLTLSNMTTTPFKFPALTGGRTDDDGDQSFPILDPSFVSEFRQLSLVSVGLLSDERDVVKAGGTFRTATTAPFVSTGSLDVTRTIITDTTPPFVSPIPKVNDLVRILSGTNGVTSFRRITNVNSPAGTLTVDTPFTTQDSGFQYTVTVSSTTVTGTASFPSATSLQDLSASFLSTAQVGWTVVVQTGSNAGQRRQVVGINSNTSLTLSPALPTLGAGTYRIDNPLDTYGGSSTDQLQRLVSLLSQEIALYSSMVGPPVDEISALEAFFDEVFTDVSVGSTGSTGIGSTTLSDVSASFVSDGVNASHYVFIRSGSVQGVYQVANVLSQTQLQVDVPFPATATGVSYRIASVFGVSKTTLLDAFSVLVGVDPLSPAAQAFQTLVSTPAPVVVTGVPDTVTFARSTMISDLNARFTALGSRITSLTNPGTGSIAKLEKPLSSSDRLYDKRYTWVDARINLESGLIVRQSRAVTNRVKTQQEVYNQLLKLLAVQGA